MNKFKRENEKLRDLITTVSENGASNAGGGGGKNNFSAALRLLIRQETDNKVISKFHYISM